MSSRPGPGTGSATPASTGSAPGTPPHEVSKHARSAGPGTPTGSQKSAGSGKAMKPEAKDTHSKGGHTPTKGGQTPPKAGKKVPDRKKEKGPCPHLCSLIPTDVPAPELTQRILHPRKDVFVLKVSKVGPNGDRRCRMELELVTPKANTKIPAYRVDTRETQCDPECTCCTKCLGNTRRKK